MDESFVHSRGADLQSQRLAHASHQPDEIQFHDRSVFCTAALAVYLGYPLPETLSREMDRLRTQAVYQKRVLFIKNLGFVTPTEARRISFEESLRFESIHEEIYRSSGFEIVAIEPGSLSDRVAAIKTLIERV